MVQSQYDTVRSRYVSSVHTCFSTVHQTVDAMLSDAQRNPNAPVPGRRGEKKKTFIEVFRCLQMHVNSKTRNSHVKIQSFMPF